MAESASIGDCDSADAAKQSEASDGDRRSFMKNASSIFMVGGLAAGYGTFAFCAGRFLFPIDTGEPAWQFVARVDQFAAGGAMSFVAPSGAKVLIARQGGGETSKDFIALSSVCPHLGCKVHWESQNERFFCPCHNGAFDSVGKATSGPPAAANQELKRFRLMVANGLLYIDLPGDSVAMSRSEAQA